MPIISPTAISPHRIGKSGINWSSYWATRTISSLAITVDSDTQFTLNWTNDGVADYDGHKIYVSTDGINYTLNKTVAPVGTSATATGLLNYTRYWVKVAPYKNTNEGTLSAADDDYTAWGAVLTSTGAGTGVSTVRFRFNTTDIVATLDGNGKFYSDSGGTTDESASYTFVAGALRTRYLKVTSGTSKLLIFAKGNWISFGDASNAGWTSGADAASMEWSCSTVNTLENLYISGTSVGTGGFSDTLKYLVLTKTWTYTGAMPTSLETLFLGGTSNWTYNGALPTSLKSLTLSSAQINWTYTGALPTGLTSINISAGNINWTYNGALPVGVTLLQMIVGNINWTYNGALPDTITNLTLTSAKMDWTGLSVGNNGNISALNLNNYRQAKMSSADMITLLTQLTSRAGNLPATITINDFQDYASPPQAVVDAVDALKTAKSVTTVNLGA